MSNRPAVVFGDVHGDCAKLLRLMKQVRDRFGAEVDIYSVGDLIDRGFDSRGVLATCVEEGVNGILGNHELWFAQVCATGEMDDGVYAPIMGGLATVKSYALDRGDPDNVGPALQKAIPKKQREFILDLPPFRSIQVGPRKYMLLHTGISADTMAGIEQAAMGYRITDEDRVDIFRTLTPGMFFWMGPKPWEPGKVAKLEDHVQIFGHTPSKAAEVHPHYIALDTGCGTCPPYTLSAVVLLPDSPVVEVLTIR